MREREPRPFYGVDGNLLVEDLEFPRKLVEAILNDTFKTKFPNQGRLYREVFRKYPHLEYEFQTRRHRRWLEMSRKLPHGVLAPALGNGPLYGVDGNLIADLDFRFSRAQIESFLDGTFKPSVFMERMAPGAAFQHYPQLHDELAKRRHRKAYRAKLLAILGRAA